LNLAWSIVELLLPFSAYFLGSKTIIHLLQVLPFHDILFLVLLWYALVWPVSVGGIVFEKKWMLRWEIYLIFCYPFSLSYFIYLFFNKIYPLYKVNIHKMISSI
jgi:hypothetical protein